MTSVPPPFPTQPARPGRAMLKWGIGLLIAGVVLTGVSVFGAILAGRGMFDFQRFVVPGTHEVALDQPGSYRIYHEHRTTFNGRTFRQTTPPAGLEVTLTDPDGQEVPLRSAAGETYSIGSREAASVFAFEAERAGAYTLHGELDPGAEPVVLAVGSGVLGMIGGLFGFICGAGLAILIGIGGIVMVIIGLVQRGRGPSAAGQVR